LRCLEVAVVEHVEAAEAAAEAEEDFVQAAAAEAVACAWAVVSVTVAFRDIDASLVVAVRSLRPVVAGGAAIRGTGRTGITRSISSKTMKSAKKRDCFASS